MVSFGVRVNTGILCSAVNKLRNIVSATFADQPVEILHVGLSVWIGNRERKIIGEILGNALFQLQVQRAIIGGFGKFANQIQMLVCKQFDQSFFFADEARYLI